MLAKRSFLAWFSDASNASSGWALPVLYRTCSDLKNIASKVRHACHAGALNVMLSFHQFPHQADKVLLRQNNGAARLEEASRLITKCWTACLNDRSVASLRRSCVASTTELLASIIELALLL